MNESKSPVTTYLCPMHRDVRQSTPGKCPTCGMDLMPEGTRFGMLRHMAKSPLMRVAMAIVILAIIVAFMGLLR